MVLLILCVFIATLPIWSQYSWFPQHWFHQPNQDNCTIVELGNGNSAFFAFVNLAHALQVPSIYVVTIN